MIRRALKVFLGLFLLFLLLGFSMYGVEGYKDAVNPYTLYHMLMGVILGLIGIRARYVLFGVVAWEFVEQVILVPCGLFEMGPPELVLDSVLDIIVALVGYLIARHIIRGAG